MRSALAAFLLFLVPASAGAGINGGYQGNCAAILGTAYCDGVRVTVNVPTPVYVGTNSEAQDVGLIWVGLAGDSSHGACSGGNKLNPLVQLGIEPTVTSSSVVTLPAWYEQFPCNSINTYGPPVISAGDAVTIELLCTSNCTPGDSTGVWQFTWNNLTTGITTSRTDTGYRVWGDTVYVVIEEQGSGVNSAGYQPIGSVSPIKFINAQMHMQGGGWVALPMVGAAAPMSPTAGAVQVASGPTRYSIYSPSSPVGTNGTTFYVCLETLATGSTLIRPCPASPSSGTAGVGP